MLLSMTTLEHPLLLLIPEKPDSERDRVGAAWIAAGGRVDRLGRFWDPPNYDPATVRLYGNATFCMVLAQKLGLELIIPADDLMIKIAPRLVKRELGVVSLGNAETISFPRFVKPLVPKQFTARIYNNINELQAECEGLEENTLMLSSELVAFGAEVRGFVLDGHVLDAAVYEGEGTLAQATELLERVAAETCLPRSCVIDVGYVADRGWAVIEANASWGAGLNGCDPEKILPALIHACRLAPSAATS